MGRIDRAWAEKGWFFTVLCWLSKDEKFNCIELLDYKKDAWNIYSLEYATIFYPYTRKVDTQKWK